MHQELVVKILDGQWHVVDVKPNILGAFLAPQAPTVLRACAPFFLKLYTFEKSTLALLLFFFLPLVGSADAAASADEDDAAGADVFAPLMLAISDFILSGTPSDTSSGPAFST